MGERGRSLYPCRRSQKKEEVALRGGEGRTNEGAKEVKLRNHCTQKDTLGTTDLSREGISHLKMQNTSNVKPSKHTPLLCRRLSVD